MFSHTVRVLLVTCAVAIPSAVRAAPPVPQVAVQAPRLAALEAPEFVGHLEATQTVELKVRVTGFLVKTPGVEGGEVKAGDVLFEIDSRSYQLEHDEARGKLAVAEAQLKRAQIESARLADLAKHNTAPKAELDLAKSQQSQAETLVALAKTAVEMSKLRLDYCVVRAPVAGRLGHHHVTVGNLCKQDETTLSTLVGMTPLSVYFPIDERTLLAMRGRIRQDAPRLAVKTAGDTAFNMNGTLDFVDNRVNDRTRTVLVRGVVPNEAPRGDGVRPLFPGLAARVRVTGLEATQEKQLFVPGTAVVTEPTSDAPLRLFGQGPRERPAEGGEYVWTVDDNDVLQSRRVTTGPWQGDARVIYTGLSEKDRVVVEVPPRAALQDGMTVKVVPRLSR